MKAKRPIKLNALKQKDKRVLNYDPEKESISLIINQFRTYLKNANYIKDYSELEIFEFFKEIFWMQATEEKLTEKIKEFSKRQAKMKAKYNNYVEYASWSENPIAESTKPLSIRKRIFIILGFALIFIIMLLIIIGLNKWW
ncbi:hypothetical protein [Metamycoplasma hyosynoviae]|uniref:Uncharacterized protein n=3 Tax=Metamycoplasma hyosynoviae TaxID=29559 RepID=A0A063YII9_9BACT|nr:hypothetical protein [Metamycoplasma hyosynoviae]ASI54030.1 hypothetical protein MHSN_02475 [Metamycoplasma hyosynoviae]KDE41909.1 hypothetical protein NPL7_01795 [Metamycoplasma hyosynoviae]KDE42569.1 hypothetical protein NPL3_01415 [Metamycoplasma hyosynoviae]KDE42889.1 hypothetical protein NPL1_02315 [Metamycoplasma hyosynoviae]KDE43797.1 hypothetical protein NPL5_01325 [Metamycoplasma hyosynoviae]